MVECGLPINEIKSKTKLSKVVGCLVSHEHLDHSKSIVELSNNGVEIFLSEGTKKALSSKMDFKNLNHKIISAGKYFKIGTFKILAFKTFHDVAEPLGFLIVSFETLETLFFATDTALLPYNVGNLNYLMIECNHSSEILERNVENLSVEKNHAERLKKTHFSLEKVEEFLKMQNLSSLKEIYLLHLSDRNSDETLFKSEIQKITGKIVKIGAEKGGWI